MGRHDGTDWIGRTVASRYRILDCIGSGASAFVFRAETTQAVEDLPKGARVALKVSRSHVLRKHRDAARFLREVQAIRRIDHPSCIHIHDWGIAEECAYIAMELVEGDDLHSVLRREAPLSATRALAIIIELCDVLTAAHAEGVVHRDLKPRNIILLPDGEGGAIEPRIKVLDFGLAKLFQPRDDDESTVPDALTKPGAVLGTPHYMSPEQVRVDGDIDGRADVYAASVILYEMLTGKRPYAAKNAVRLLVLRSTSDPDPPSRRRPDLDPELDDIVMRGLAREPDDRVRSAEALRKALAAIFPRIAEEEAPLADVRGVSDDGSVPTDTLDEDPSLGDSTLRESNPIASGSHGDGQDDEDEEGPTQIFNSASAGERSPRSTVYLTLSIIAAGAAAMRLLGWW